MTECNSRKFKPYSNRLNFKTKQCGKNYLISSSSQNIFLDKYFQKEKNQDQQELRKQYLSRFNENLERKSQEVLKQRSPNYERTKKKFLQQKEMYLDQMSIKQELSFSLKEQIQQNDIRVSYINHQKGKSLQQQIISPFIKQNQKNKSINRKFRTSGSNLQSNDQKIISKIKNLSIYSQTVQLSILSDNQQEKQKLSQTQEILELKKEQDEFTNIYNTLLIKLTEQQNETLNYKNKFNDLESKYIKISEEKERNEKIYKSQQLELMKNYNANMEINQKQIEDLTIQTENYKKENNLLKEEKQRLMNLQEEEKSNKYNQLIQEIQQLKLELQLTKDLQKMEQQKFQQQLQQLQEINSKNNDLTIQTENFKLEINLLKAENKRLFNLQEEYSQNYNQSIYQFQQMKQELQQTKEQLIQEQFKFQQTYQQQLQEIKTKDELCQVLKFKLHQQDQNIQALKDQLSQYQVNQSQQQNRLQNEYSQHIEQNQIVIDNLQAEKTQLFNELIIFKHQHQENESQIQRQMKLLQEYHSKNEELQNKIKNYEIYFFDIQLKIITPLNQDGIKVTVKQGSTLQELFNYVSFKCYFNYSYELTSINIIEKRCNYRSNQWNKRIVDIFSGEELLKCQMIEFQTV